MNVERKNLNIRGIEEEPSMAHGHMPVFFFVALAAALFGALVYLDEAGGGFNNRVYAPYTSYARVLADQPQDETARVKAIGRQKYIDMCQLCHQPNGLGTPGQFPPLDGSEWVSGPIPRLARIPLHGLQGPITVKGENWNAAMPAMGASLNAEDLAALLTYIRSEWSNRASAVTPEQAKKAIDATAGRAEPWTADELAKVPETE